MGTEDTGVTEPGVGPGPEPGTESPAEPYAEPTLTDRFPALRGIGSLRQKRIPFVQQLTMNECGIASLCMVLGYHGKHVPMEELRALIAVDTDGVTAQSVMDVAGFFGLRVRGVVADLGSLDELPTASILHWKFNHFVVYESATEDYVQILDPARGRVRVPMEKFSQAFTGVAIVCEPDEEFTPRAPAKSRVRRYLLSVLGSKGIFVRIGVTSLVLQIFALAMPLATGAIVDRIIPRGDGNLLAIMSVGVFGMLVFSFLATWVRAHLFVYLRANLDVRLTMGFFEHFIELPFPFFQHRPSGDLLSRLGDKNAIIEGMTTVTLSALVDGVLVALYLALLMVMSPSMGLTVLGLALVQVVTYLRSATRLKELNSENLEVSAKASAGISELILGMETLKSMGVERSMLRNWSNLFAASLNSQLERGALEANLSSFLSTLRSGSPLVILLLGAYDVLHNGMSLGAMLALNALAAGFLAPVSNLVQTALSLRTLTSHAERLDDIHNTPRERDRGALTLAAPLRGAITLDHVSFRYGALTPPVVRDVSLKIKAGQFVAIVGPSGSGKSTLAGLLLGFYSPTEGRVSYDDTDLATLDLTSVRRQLGVVTQKPFLFQASVRNNISMMDPQMPREQVIEAAKKARIHEDILAMPLGYDSMLAEGGSSLSGGQRQRLALARALVRRPAVLLLDEATSALDSVTERAVQEELARIQCTKIVIAHRLSTVVAADLILVVDQGRIVEAGHHNDLLRRNGLYANLVSAQLGVG